MSALLTTLPGDIPGLLRRGSPVLYGNRPRVVEDVEDSRLGGLALHPEQFATCLLDLTDATGRWHAALWARAARNDEPWSLPENDAASLALLGVPLKPYEITLLRNVVLRLAGRTP